MQEKEDWDFSDDFFFLAPAVILWEQTFTAQAFLFSFWVKSVSLSRHEHAATNIKVTTIGSAHNNEFFLLLVREFPFPSLPFYLPKSAGDISVVNYEGKNVFDFFVPFSSKKKRLFLKKYFGMKEAP